MAPKTTFAEINVAHTGDVCPKPQLIAKWLHYHGGTLSHEVTARVTHLVCSKAAWEAKPQIGMASKIPQKVVDWLIICLVQDALAQPSCEIVTFDWLEDSLLQKSRKPKPEKGYRWQEPGEDEKPKRSLEEEQELADRRRQAHKLSSEAREILSDIGLCVSRHEPFTYLTYVKLPAKRPALPSSTQQPFSTSSNTPSPRTSKSLTSLKRPKRKRASSSSNPSKKPSPERQTYRCVALTSKEGVTLDEAMNAFKAEFKKKTGRLWILRNDQEFNGHACAGEGWKYIIKKTSDEGVDGGSEGVEKKTSDGAGEGEDEEEQDQGSGIAQRLKKRKRNDIDTVPEATVSSQGVEEEQDEAEGGERSTQSYSQGSDSEFEEEQEPVVRHKKKRLISDAAGGSESEAEEEPAMSRKKRASWDKFVEASGQS
ncbi:MAG: hypothetical protein Q9227_006998 [Pyrenula ochraceoflavens]